MICPACGGGFERQIGKRGCTQIYCRREDCQRKRRTQCQVASRKRRWERDPMTRPGREKWQIVYCPDCGVPTEFSGRHSRLCNVCQYERHKARCKNYYDRTMDTLEGRAKKCAISKCAYRKQISTPEGRAKRREYARRARSKPSNREYMRKYMRERWQKRKAERAEATV